ncbi:hypothetical protein CH063_03661, partial [Colletotrichum higginsianum]
GSYEQREPAMGVWVSAFDSPGLPRSNLVSTTPSSFFMLLSSVMKRYANERIGHSPREVL